MDFSSDNHLSNFFAFDQPIWEDKEPQYVPNVPSLAEVIKRKQTSYADSEYYDFESDDGNRKTKPTRRLSLSESVGGSFIHQKLSQLGAVLRRADETLDAVFTLLVPGKRKS